MHTKLETKKGRKGERFAKSRLMSERVDYYMLSTLTQSVLSQSFLPLIVPYFTSHIIMLTSV